MNRADRTSINTAAPAAALISGLLLQLPAQGQGLAPNSPSSRAQASCQKLADLYKPLANDHPGRQPLDVLAQATAATVTLAAPLTAPVAIAAEDIPADGTLERLPNTNYYSVSQTQGTMHCIESHYFRLRRGHTVPASAPPGFGDDDAEASCGTRQTFGTVDGVPVLFRENYDWTPSMSADIKVATWGGQRFLGSCDVLFEYAPRFTPETLNSWGDSCTGSDCDALRAAAFTLVAAVQADSVGTTQRQTALLSPEQTLQYQQALNLANPPKGPQQTADENAPRDPADLTADMPLRLPALYQGQLYLVSLGHFTIGWRYFGDWSVKFQTLDDGKLVERGSFAVGMTKGNLVHVTLKAAP